jgi:hypothetical protein
VAWRVTCARGWAVRPKACLAHEVDARVGVQDCGAALAAHGVVRHTRQLRDGPQRRVERAQRQHALGCLQPRVGPHIPVRAGNRRVSAQRTAHARAALRRRRARIRRAGGAWRAVSRQRAAARGCAQARNLLRCARRRSSAIRPPMRRDPRGRAHRAHQEKRTPSAASSCAQSGAAIAPDGRGAVRRFQKAPPPSARVRARRAGALSSRRAPLAVPHADARRVRGRSIQRGSLEGGGLANSTGGQSCSLLQGARAPPAQHC